MHNVVFIQEVDARLVTLFETKHVFICRLLVGHLLLSFFFLIVYVYLIVARRDLIIIFDFFFDLIVVT